MIMSYTLTRVIGAWEIQNGSGIKVVIPKLSLVEEAIEMLSKKPTVKEPEVKKSKMDSAGKKQVIANILVDKKAMTARQITDFINKDMDDETRGAYNIVLSILGKSKVLKRVKNKDGIFVYSRK
jgi:hypothetical protein